MASSASSPERAAIRDGCSSAWASSSTAGTATPCRQASRSSTATSPRSTTGRTARWSPRPRRPGAGAGRAPRRARRGGGRVGNGRPRRSRRRSAAPGTACPDTGQALPKPIPGADAAKTSSRRAETPVRKHRWRPRARLARRRRRGARAARPPRPPASTPSVRAARQALPRADREPRRLAEDGSWVKGQCQAMRAEIEDGLSARGVRAVGDMLHHARKQHAEVRERAREGTRRPQGPDHADARSS